MVFSGLLRHKISISTIPLLQQSCLIVNQWMKRFKGTVTAKWRTANGSQTPRVKATEKTSIANTQFRSEELRIQLLAYTFAFVALIANC